MQKKRKKQAKNPFGLMKKKKKKKERKKMRMKSRNQNSPKAFGELKIWKKVQKASHFGAGTYINANYFENRIALKIQIQQYQNKK